MKSKLKRLELEKCTVSLRWEAGEGEMWKGSWQVQKRFDWAVKEEAERLEEKVVDTLSRSDRTMLVDMKWEEEEEEGWSKLMRIGDDLSDSK